MRTLIVGHFGEGNLGDDLLLDVLVDRMRAVVPRSEVMATWGGRSTWLAPSIRLIGRAIEDIDDALATVDSVIIGPGGILHNARGYGNLHHDTGINYYDRITAAAQDRGLPIAGVGIGLGPISGSAARRVARRVLDRCVSITVRDARSAEFALSIGVGRTVLVPDLAWGTSVIDDATRPTVVDGQLGLSLRPWKNAATTNRLASNVAGAIDLLVADGVVSSVVGVPMSVNDDPRADDRRVLSDVLQEVDSGVPSRVAELSSRRDAELVFAGSSVVLAMRLHAMILAASLGTPTVGITYDEKVASVAAMSRGSAIALNTSPEEIAERIHVAMASPPRQLPDNSSHEVTDQLISFPSGSAVGTRTPSAAVSSLERILVALGL